MRYIFGITLILTLAIASAQTSENVTSLPKVFLIGEYEEQYLSLSKAHPALYMSVFDNDIDLAYRSWTNCLADMEDAAARLDFDLKGVKLWINMYFNEDGTIAHLAFYPKPNSRNVPDEHLTAFFKNFVREYKLPVHAEKPFQHSTSASFPTLYDRHNPVLAKKGGE